MDDSILRPLVKSLDNSSTVGTATQTLQTLLQNANEGATSLAEKLAQLAAGLETYTGKVAFLGLAGSYAPSVPEVITLAVDLSHDEQWPARQAAATFLAKVVETSAAAEQRLIELLSDPHPDVANIAIGTVPRMRTAQERGGISLTLHVIPDDEKRAEALDLLDRLEHATNVLRDRGDLNEGQVMIVEDLIFPKIVDLRNLLGGVSANMEQVVADRKRSLVSLSGLIDSAKALAFTVTAVGSADEAGANVINAAQTLTPLIEVLKDLAS